MTLLQTFRDGGLTRKSTSRSRRINWPVFWLAMVWWYVETKHYGWNVTAQSDAEMFCDGLVFLLVALACRPAVNGGSAT